MLQSIFLGCAGEVIHQWPGPNIAEAPSCCCSTQHCIQIGEQITCRIFFLLIPWRLFLMRPPVMTSSLKALLYRDPEILFFFFFWGQSFHHHIGKFPRQPWLFLNPYISENITLPPPPDFSRENSSEFEKLRPVRTEFPGVVSLPWNSVLSGSTPNTTRIKEGARIICQIVEETRQFHRVVTVPQNEKERDDWNKVRNL